MKKMIALALVAGSLATAAQAATIVVNQGAYSYGTGGEFNATISGVGFTPLALTNSGSFETFCLEIPENFQPGATYNVTINTFADAGGNGGQVGSTDPLDDRTAGLYYAFITGTLAGYDYADAFGQRKNNAGALQNAIWYLENEVGTLDSADAIAYFNIAQTYAGQGLGLVRVANLYDNAGGKHQSQLIAIPTPGVLAGFAAAGVFASRRRRA
jgi:hypothetical protein